MGVLVTLPEMQAEAEPAVICVRPDFLLQLLTELGRHRALADHETDLVEDIVNMGQVAFRWDPRADRALLTASHSPGGIARFARRYGVTLDTAHSRLYRLRGKRQTNPSASARRKG